MTYTGHSVTRVLGLDLCHRGVGFVVLESPRRLVDWGVKQAHSRTDRQEIARADELIRLYRPHVVALEDVDHPACRRRSRARRITKAIQTRALKSGIIVFRCDPRKVRKTFAESGAQTKHQVAAAVALRFSALIRHLPPVRKPWMSEDPRFAIFDAASFAMTYLHDCGEDVRSC